MEPHPPLPSSWQFLIGFSCCYAAAHLVRFVAPKLGLNNVLGLNREEEYSRIRDIIDRKGAATAYSMTLGELAEELRDYGSIWSNLVDSNEKGGMKSDCAMSHVHVKPEDVAATDPFASGL